LCSFVDRLIGQRLVETKTQNCRAGLPAPSIFMN
jgi:hypothetical protein